MHKGRFQRIRDTLLKRQMDLTVCLEHVHKPQNVSAVLRTCDAVGIHQVNIVWNQETYFRRGTAMGSQKWLTHHKHQSIEAAHQCFKAQNMQVLVTNLSDTSVDFREIDYTQPTAIIMGQEKHGATAEAIALCDHQITIPMMGMVQSLNVSVAAALVLYEAQRQRQIVGLYDQVTISKAELNATLFEGCHPLLYKQCVSKGLPLPTLDDEGEVLADEHWWQAMQLTPEALEEMQKAQSYPAPRDDLFSNLHAPPAKR